MEQISIKLPKSCFEGKTDYFINSFHKQISVNNNKVLKSVSLYEEESIDGNDKATIVLCFDDYKTSLIPFPIGEYSSYVADQYVKFISKGTEKRVCLYLVWNELDSYAGDGRYEKIGVFECTINITFKEIN